MTVHIAATMAALGPTPQDAGQVCGALIRCLPGLEPATLPAEAQIVWTEIARLLKINPSRSPAAAAIAAARSWPAARVAMLIEALRRLAAILERIDNERQLDAIRTGLERVYL